MINVGIDVHKKRCQACLKDEKGKLIEELSIPNTTEGAEQLARMLTTYGEAKIVLESTGNLWIRLYDTLNQRPSQSCFQSICHKLMLCSRSYRTHFRLLCLLGCDNALPFSFRIAWMLLWGRFNP